MRKDRRTGKVVKSPRWTIEYRADGRPVSEPARSPDYAVAEALLRRRIAEIDSGSYGGADARTVRIKRLLDLLLEHFIRKTNQGHWSGVASSLRVTLSLSLATPVRRH